MHVVATAGHVDHGKSTLVRALTGMEPDRWAEERRRGMTLDLGFAWTTLPTGETVAFVDVPGHERFVANALAGVGPVPAVVFVVAADEGWRAQSAEHLLALDALGVRAGLLVVTRSDLADPGPARASALRELGRTGLADVASVCVSAVTGAGLDELRGALSRLVNALPVPDPDADVRLWVDRAFTVRGAGTVVTATLGAGTLCSGDELAVSPGDRRVVVRSLQTLGRAVDSVAATARVAVNLRGVALDEVGRGDALLSPGRWLATQLTDVRLRGRPEDAAALPSRLTLHVGSAAVPVRVRTLGESTARLTLDRPLPLRVGDVAVLRDPGRRAIAAGVQVLDVRPPALTRRGAAAARDRVLAPLDGRPDGAGELRRRGLVRAGELRAMGVTPPGPPVAGDWLLDPAHRRRLSAQLAAAVTEYNAAHPLEPGAPVEVLRQRLGLPDVRLVAAVVAPPMTVRAGRVLPGPAAPALPPEVQRAADALRAELKSQPFAAPDAPRLAQLGLHPPQLAAAVRAGAALKVADGVYLLPGADRQAARLLAELPQPFTVSDARTKLRTTRRVAVPLLELLAVEGRTRRLADGRHEVTGAGGPTA